MPKLFFFHGPLAEKGGVGKEPQFYRARGLRLRTPLKIKKVLLKKLRQGWRRYGQLNSGDDLDTNRKQILVLSQIERKFKPFMAKLPEYFRQSKSQSRPVLNQKMPNQKQHDNLCSSLWDGMKNVCSSGGDGVVFPLRKMKRMLLFSS
jgi:hypothetical protein